MFYCIPIVTEHTTVKTENNLVAALTALKNDKVKEVIIVTCLFY